MTSRNRDYGTLSAHQKPTVGDIKMSAASLDHMGWLLCDGRLLNVNEFYFLFSIIEYSFGRVGVLFRLPYPAGRVPGTIGDGSGLTSRSLGDSIGDETHVLTIPEMPAHNHNGTTMSAVGHINISTNAGPDSSGTPGPAGEVPRGSFGLISDSSGEKVTTLAGDNLDITAGEPDLLRSPAKLLITDPGHQHAFTIPSQGLSQAHTIMQPTLFMGNTFIYSGKPNYGTYPYTTNLPYSSTTLIL